MRRNYTVFRMCAAAMLIAVGIIIPAFSPVKIMVEPMSFTLASHVAIFIAMFISPSVAVTVAAGTTLGFFLGGFPVVIVLRAASHLVFTVIGAFYLKRKPKIWNSPVALLLFNFAIGAVHAVCEMVVVAVFFFGGAYEGQSFLRVVLLLVGLGTVAHSMVDFVISQVIVKVLGRQVSIRGLFHVYNRNP